LVSLSPRTGQWRGGVPGWRGGCAREGGEGDMVEEKRHGGREETYAKKQERKETQRERKEEGKR
jgi:hypothetical protein